jgi:hypothetical protein
MSSQMAIATIRELQDRWAKELASTLPTQVVSADSSGNPVLTLSADATPATGEKVVVIRCLPVVGPGFTDVLGSTQTIFSPMRLQICTELNYAATTDNVADILTAVELLPVIAGCAKRGMVVEWYQSANGTVPSTTQISSTTLKATWQPNLFQGIGGSI